VARRQAFNLEALVHWVVDMYFATAAAKHLDIRRLSSSAARVCL
jgi:hypothetical protein